VQKNTPIEVWLYSLLIVTIFFMGFLYLPIKNRLNHIDFVQLEKLELMDKKKKNIVVVGTSLTGYALYPDKEMNDLAKKQGIEKLNFLRFSHNSRDLNYFNNLFEQLLQYKPDILFLDASLIFYDRRKQNDLQKYIQNIKIYIRQALNFHNKILDYEIHVQKYIKKKTSIRIAKWKKNIVYMTRREHKITIALKRLITIDKKENIKIYIIDFSRAKEAQHIFPKEFSEYEEKMVEYYQQKYNIGYIKYPFLLPKDYFIDFAHANIKGREEISKFFLLKVKEILEGEN